MSDLKGRKGIAAYFRNHIGEIVTSDDLRQASGNQMEWGRRVRELRLEYGYRIETHRDSLELKPGQYRLVEQPPDKPPPRFSRQISQKTRAQVLARNGSTCQLCGRGTGDDFEDGARVLLHVDHIHNKSEGGSDDLANLRTLCQRCNEGAKDVLPPPPDRLWLMGRIRAASNRDQKAVYEWLCQKFKADTP